jgi:hypothetical protein
MGSGKGVWGGLNTPLSVEKRLPPRVRSLLSREGDLRFEKAHCRIMQAAEQDSTIAAIHQNQDVTDKVWPRDTPS